MTLDTDFRYSSEELTGPEKVAQINYYLDQHDVRMSPGKSMSFTLLNLLRTLMTDSALLYWSYTLLENDQYEGYQNWITDKQVGNFLFLFILLTHFIMVSLVAAILLHIGA